MAVKKLSKYIRKNRTKILTLSLIFVSSFFFVFEAFALGAEQEHSTTWTAGQWLGCNSTYYCYQSFTPTTSYSLADTIARVANFTGGACTGNIDLEVYATSGDTPTGSALGTSNLIPCSSLSTDQINGGLTDFTFSPAVALTNGTKYVFKTTLTDNYVLWFVDTSNPYAGGLGCRSDGCTSGYDAYFDNYNNGGGGGTPPTTTSTLPSFIGLSAFDFVGTSTLVGSSTIWSGSYIVNSTTQAMLNIFTDKTQTNLFYGYILFLMTSGGIIAYFNSRFK